MHEPPSSSARFGRRPASRRARSALFVSLLAALVASAPRRAATQPPTATLQVFAPARSLAADEQSSAVTLNPANLAFMPSAELRWTWDHTGQGATVPSRGHAFDLAFPLPFHLGTGFALDLVRPPDASPAPLDAPYAWFTWGLAVKATDAFSLGFSLRHSYADDPRISGATGIGFAMTVRPNPYAALAVVARDVNGPHTSAAWKVDRSYDFGLTLRPTGRRDFELSLEARYFPNGEISLLPPGFSGESRWVPSAIVGIDVPYVGRLRGEIALSDPISTDPVVYTATAGLELGWEGGAAEGGALFGSGLDGSDGAGFYTSLAVSGRRNPGLPEPAYAIKIRIEDTPSAREHAHLLRRLWRLAQDRELRAVAFELKTEPADSMAHAEELGDAIRLLRAAGKKVLCHLEDAGGRSLYVCSQADRVYINPAGGIRFAGLRAQYTYYAGVLEKLGVRAQFIRIGAHKTAPEAFTQRGPSEVAKSDYLDLLNEYNEVYLHDVAGGRHIPLAQLRETIANGPFVATEARAGGLVDDFAFDDEIDRAIAETLGHRVPVRDEPRLPYVPSRFGPLPHIAVVYVEGDMIDGRSRHVPLVGTNLVGSYTVAAAIKQAREDSHVRAVVLRVESPGGSSMAADVIWREVAITTKVKPVIVSMGSYAASGGYYIAAPGTKIIANPLTVTGSIGIFYGKADIAELMGKIGLNVETFRTAPHADAESIYRPFTPDEITLLEHKVAQFYDTFLDRVAQGRHMTKAQVDAIGQGRVWTGREALSHGLVDELGGFREAIEEARRMTGLPLDTPIEELPVPEKSLLDRAIGLAGVEAPEAPEASALIPPAFLSTARALAPLLVFDPDKPLSRLPWVPIEEP